MGKEIPKAKAEGDKLPEDKRKDVQDPMNSGSGSKENKKAPEANAEGDKLPEEDD